MHSVTGWPGTAQHDRPIFSEFRAACAMLLGSVMRGLLVLFLVVAGCGSADDSNTTKNETARPYVTIAVAPPSAELAPGATVQLKVSLVGDDGSQQPVAGTFSSNNETIARVDENSGVVTAVAKGTTMITAHYGPGTAFASITVK